MGLVKGLKLREAELIDKMDKVQKVSRKQIMLESAAEILAESDVKVRKPLFRTRQKKTIAKKT